MTLLRFRCKVRPPSEAGRPGSIRSGQWSPSGRELPRVSWACTDTVTVQWWYDVGLWLLVYLCQHERLPATIQHVSETAAAENTQSNTNYASREDIRRNPDMEDPVVIVGLGESP